MRLCSLRDAGGEFGETFWFRALGGADVPSVFEWATIVVWDREGFLQVATDYLIHWVRVGCRWCDAPETKYSGAQLPSRS
jgi:hypothetical protein